MRYTDLPYGHDVTEKKDFHGFFLKIFRANPCNPRTVLNFLIPFNRQSKHARAAHRHRDGRGQG